MLLAQGGRRACMYAWRRTPLTTLWDATAHPGPPNCRPPWSSPPHLVLTPPPCWYPDRLTLAERAPAIPLYLDWLRHPPCTARAPAPPPSTQFHPSGTHPTTLLAAVLPALPSPRTAVLTWEERSRVSRKRPPATRVMKAWERGRGLMRWMGAWAGGCVGGWACGVRVCGVCVCVRLGGWEWGCCEPGAGGWLPQCSIPEVKWPPPTGRAIYAWAVDRASGWISGDGGGRRCVRDGMHVPACQEWCDGHGQE